MADALSIRTPVGIVGAGTMGAGIAEVAATAGHPVLLSDTDAGRAESAKAGIAKRLERQAERGRISEAERDARLARLQPLEKLEGLGPAGLVIEAIVEDLAAKQELFLRLEDVVAEDALLATNTSSLSITAIGAPLARPGRVLGLHFFNPAPAMRLVEVVSGLETDPSALETAAATARAWHKESVLVHSWPGFLVNRVARPFYAEALRLVQEQAIDPASLDRVLCEAGGFRMGPFALMDLIGLDVNLAVTRSVFEATHGDRRYAPSWLQEERVRAGHLGRKTGRGFFAHAAAPPAVAELPLGPRPERIQVEGDLGPAVPLIARAEAAGISVEQSDGPGLIQLPGATLGPSDGRLATARGHLVLFDLALDYATTPRLAMAASDTVGEAGFATAAGFFQALGIAPVRFDDAPGLALTRILAMLANEAAEAVQFGIAAASDVDRAMRLGVNYPAGPLAWAERVGLGRIVAVLDHLHASYGEERYRCCPLLRRKALAGASFYAP